MIRALPLAVLGLLIVGCGSPVVTTRTHRTTLADNTQNFDRYVERRTETLAKNGAFKNRQDAEAKARSEATILYGERIPEVSTSWSWTWTKDKKTTPLRRSALDQLAQDEKKR